MSQGWKLGYESQKYLPDPGADGGGWGTAPILGGEGGFPDISIPGYTPDYKGLIASDPGYLQLQADTAAGSTADRASLAAARQRGLIQFGEVPSDLIGANLGLVGGDFNQDIGNARTLAEQNTTAGLSTVARLRLQNQDAVRTITNALAGRGLLRSGETGYQQGRQGERYTQAQFDARQKLLDFLGQIQASFTQSERARQAAYAQGISQAEANQRNANPGRPGQVATRGADGVYRTPDGAEYDAEGNQIVGGVGAAPVIGPVPGAPTYVPQPSSGEAPRLG